MFLSPSSVEQILWAATGWAASTSAYEDTGETWLKKYKECRFLVGVKRPWKNGFKATDATVKHAGLVCGPGKPGKVTEFKNSYFQAWTSP